jgi:poly(A) polymerase Pap1
MIKCYFCEIKSRALNLHIFYNNEKRVEQKKKKQKVEGKKAKKKDLNSKIRGKERERGGRKRRKIRKNDV